jgi:protein phosphatase
MGVVSDEFYRKYANLDKTSLSQTLNQVSVILDTESKLIQLSQGRIYFVGDTHGNFGVTVHAFKHLDPLPGSIHSRFDKIVFLGDFIDRGLHAIYNVNFLMSMKVLYPDRVILIRGNHETRETNMRYGFYEEILAKYDMRIFEQYNQIFAKLPLAVITWNNLFAVHGGIPEGLEHLNQINGLDEEMDPDDRITFQILWNDPIERDGQFFKNSRGKYSKTFGKEAFEYFLQKHNVQTILRAHEIQKKGFRAYFDTRLISLDSSEKGWRNPEVKVFILEANGEYRIATMEEYCPFDYSKTFI